MNRKPFLSVILVALLLMSVSSMAAVPPAAASALPDFAAAGPAIEAAQAASRQSQAQLLTMPVYAIVPTLVNDDIILGNAGRLNGIAATSVFSETSRGGLDHFFAFNPDTGNVVDQFNRTGGLFAVNATRAFSETEMTVNPTNTAICLFLANRQLFPAQEVEPQYTDCRGNPSYIVKQIHLSTLDPGSGRGTNAVIGELVQVPLAIDIGGIAPVYIPMGGPGGHLSLLLAGDAATPAVDSSLPGLQAMALPWYGRSRHLTPIGSYPVVPQSVAVERFKAQFPAEMNVNAGTPVMVYYVGFPDVPQDAVMPMWTFPDATGTISGTVVSLKNSALPGVEGFAPTVSIISPADGTVILPDQPVSMTFSIGGDQGPFTYTISSDSNVVATGVAVSGTHTVGLGVLPPFEGRPEGHMLSVHAVNSYNIAGDAALFLGTAQLVYLPLVLRASSVSSADVPLNSAPAMPPLPAAPGPAAVSANPRIGVEWVMNYHNPQLNLGQTQPDAEGLYNWLGSIGWSKSFDYGNDAAWEKDWRDCSLGGIDCTLGVDHADFAYFSGHGSPSSWYFGVARDYGGAWAGNARFQNVRWAAFSSCQTVRAGPYVGPGNPPLTDWFDSFKGSYMVLGFHSVMGDVPFGFTFGFQMRNPLYTFFPSLQPSIRQAWVNSAFAMNAGKPAYLYAVGNLNPVDYKLPAPGSGPLPPLTGIYQFRWVWWDE
jgi:hypothetical protein